ncbi:hypothetical protein Agub_g2946 [Astrephomene gubernaculifera]|uniref:Peptidase S54 rhomboid domain-containing protein n=1 Tax=Astrephomene gubernaculifera TaxID=47775 RepID=A0AAD3DHU5_9CHLO|nr:hypothetical protein Agub_g2946 [Astrephomene gubernaculifera]
MTQNIYQQTMSGLDNLGAQLASSARDVWDRATSTVNRIADSISVPPRNGSLERLVRPPLERGMAAWRWSAFGQSTVVPFPPPRWDDPRMLVTIFSLTHTLYDELDAHHNHQLHGSPSPTSASFPLPPVTTTLAAASIWRYFTPALLREVCLSPYCVVERREVARLWSACIAHIDAPHLMSNLAAMLPDAAALERASGPAAFAADVGLLAALSSGLFVGWAVFEKEVLERPNTFYAVGAVGLSSLAFALQVMRGEARRDSPVSLLGIPVPAQFAWVAQLGLTHLVTAPDTSFAGHMCGVLAGIAHTYLIKPALRALLGGGPASQPQPRFYGSGTTSGRPVSGSSGSGSGSHGAGDPQQQWRRRLAGALSQLALAAGAVLVYALAAQKRQRQPLSDLRLR